MIKRPNIANHNELCFKFINDNPEMSCLSIARLLKHKHPKTFENYKVDSIRRHLCNLKPLTDTKDFRDARKEELTALIKEKVEKYPEAGYKEIASKLKLKSGYHIDTLAKMVSSYRQFGDIYG